MQSNAKTPENRASNKMFERGAAAVSTLEPSGIPE
jgi:hypothetical protein